MRQDMKLAAGIEVDVVVARANPVAVIVRKRVIYRQESQDAIDIEDRSQRSLKLFRRRGVQNPGQVDERGPRLGIILAFDFIGAGISARAVAPILESRAAVRPPWRLPSGPCFGLVPLLKEGFIDLFHVLIDAPTLAIDDNANKICARGGKEVARGLKIEHAAQEGRIGM